MRQFVRSSCGEFAVSVPTEMVPINDFFGYMHCSATKGAPRMRRDAASAKRKNRMSAVSASKLSDQAAAKGRSRLGRNRHVRTTALTTGVATASYVRCTCSVSGLNFAASAQCRKSPQSSHADLGKLVSARRIKSDVRYEPNFAGCCATSNGCFG